MPLDQVEAVHQALKEQRAVPTHMFESWAHTMDPAELGRLVKEYVAESNHNGWDGFSRQHLTGIRAMLSDMIRYYHSSIDTRPNHFKELSNLNIK